MKANRQKELRLDSFCVEPITTNGLAVNDEPMSGQAYTRHKYTVDLTEFQLHLLGHFFGEGTTMPRSLPTTVLLCPTILDIFQCDTMVMRLQESNVWNDPNMPCSLRAFVGHRFVAALLDFGIFGCVSYQGIIVLTE
jgi:hypothetical protein